jgi:hypothetical protein
MAGLSEALDESREEGTDWSADIDFSGSDENVPAGWYPVVVKSAKKGKSHAGNDKVSLACAITEGPYKGRFLYLHLSLVPKALWKTRKHLKNMGIEVGDDGSFKLSPSLLVDREFDAEVTDRSAEFGGIDNVRELSGTTLDDA